MNKTTALLGIIGALILGFVIRGFTNPDGPTTATNPSSPTAVKSAAPDPSVERFKVAVGNAPTYGSPGAKVTIVEFSDYQCPFCGRVEPTLDQIKRTYGKDVRVAFKHNPLPMHPQAAPAARAAMAAREQGDDKFWQYHELLFKNQDKLDEASLEKFAGEVGLNVAKWKSDYGQNKVKYDAQIKADQTDAEKYGANGTPSFFINGRSLSGAQPFDSFKKIIDEEITAADKVLRAGTRPEQIYATLIQNGKENSAPARAAFEIPTQVFKVPVGNAPVQGPETAKVTIIEFSDFQCPFCSRVVPTIHEIHKLYGNDVRIAFKQNPLPMHPQAPLAAEASLAADEQGKFWEMHDKLFANAKALERADLERYAQEVGLDMAKFKAALESGKFKARIAADQAEAGKFGARGTPSFFINGRPVRGARPLDDFKKVIDHEIELANAKLKEGVAPSALYAELTKDGQDKVNEPAPRPAPTAEPQDNVVYKATIGDAPVRGPKDAKVTIVMWSDYQCPFCSRVEPTVTKVLETYPKDVRVAFKQLPLPFHQNAHLAAEASLAAKEQGKFWEMHDKLFANQNALDRASIEKYAQEMGLNMKKFRDALDSGKWKAKVDAELAEGNKIGANGTPAFFINGKSLSGAQPFENFKAKIDASLAEVDALMKQKRVPLRAVYDEIMKGAKEQVEAAAAKGGDDDDDKTIYKVDAGNGPSWGSPTAPVTIVEFSDFQCPFCSKVLPTVKQIKEKYAGKVRIVWRNYPLPFHSSAPLAAEAAMAADAQGRFWDMHDKLFNNQNALDRASLERYAQELGLDVGRFKADLDGGRFKAAVDADVKYANSLPGGGMGTPTFFINGKKIAGAYPFEKFDAMIKDAMNRK